MFPFQSSLFTYEDKGSYEKIIISPSEQQMEGNESSPFDMQSQKKELDNKEQEEGHPTGELDPAGLGGRLLGAPGALAASQEALMSPRGCQRAGLYGIFLGLRH